MFIVQLIIGAALLALGANYLTEGSSAIAKRFNLSEFLIGATIVAIGTSMPELVVSTMSAIQGQGDVSMGNIVGSNILNIYLILGLTALVSPMALKGENIRRDIPIYIATSLLLCLLALDSSFFGSAVNRLGRIDGIVLLIGYGLFMWLIISGEKRAVTPTSPTPSQANTKSKGGKLWLSALMVVGGLAGLVWGADLFLDGAIVLAHKVGLSEAVISIVLVALGTSLPELCTSVIAAIKGNTDIALGNLLGSNISNILLILGLSATINPLTLGGVNMVDMGVMFSTSIAVLLTVFCFKRSKVDRIEGAIFLLIYVIYTLYLLR